MQTAAVRWGFLPEDVGLVTGNRRENPDARVLVVVAEILLNRLLHSGQGGKGERRKKWLVASGQWRVNQQSTINKQQSLIPNP